MSGQEQEGTMYDAPNQQAVGLAPPWEEGEGGPAGDPPEAQPDPEQPQPDPQPAPDPEPEPEPQPARAKAKKDG